jgi:hypothetical protein
MVGNPTILISSLLNKMNSMEMLSFCQTFPSHSILPTTVLSCGQKLAISASDTYISIATSIFFFMEACDDYSHRY